MLRRDEEAKDKLKELIENNAGMIPFIDEGKYSVSYGIITKNDIQRKSKSLPIFSRISLLRTVHGLKTMNIPIKIHFIYDNVDRKNLNVDTEE